MISLVYIMLLCASCYVQATSTDSLEPEKGSAIQAVESKELMMVVANDVPSPVRQQPAKRKVLRPEEREKPFLNVLFEHKTLSTMNFDELKEKKDECLKNNDMETAIKYLDRMMHLKTDLNELKSLMLEMAQMLFDKKDYAKASQMFNKFALLYPGSDEVELAMYQAIISNSNLMLDAEHDQSKTIETKELAQAFLERPSFTHYKKEVEIIAKQCDERLLESDINVFNFYMSRGNYVAANTRLEGIKKDFSSKPMPDITTRLACLDKCYADATVNIKSQELTTEIAAQEKEALPEQPTEQTV
jgi:outer membrane assembly lipoprotein YfiO